MNQVDVYINNERLDLFQDEQISINVSVQNIKDLATIFTDFTQSFTVPASLQTTKSFRITIALTLQEVLMEE